MTAIWWHLARATGLVAWWLSSLSVFWGLALSGRVVRKRGAPAWILDIHRFLGAITVAFTVVHVGAVLADDYVEFRVIDALLPFAASWRPGAVAWGVVAFHLLVVVEVTSLLKRRIRPRMWRALHATSFVTFILTTAHAFTAGHDAPNRLVQWSALTLASAFVFLLTYRSIGPRGSAHAAARGRVA